MGYFGLVAASTNNLRSAGHITGFVAKAEIQDTKSKTRQVCFGQWLQGAKTVASTSSHQRQTGAAGMRVCVGVIHVCIIATI